MKQHNKCNPELLPMQWDLMADDLDYINLKNIKEKCSCIYKATCCRILELIRDRKVGEASQMYLTTFKNKNDLSNNISTNGWSQWPNQKKD